MRIRLRHEQLAEHLARGRRSQNAWAMHLGLHKGHLSRLVNGKRPYPGAETRQKLLDGLELSFEDLFWVEVEDSADSAALRSRQRGAWQVAVDAYRLMTKGDGPVKTLLQDIRFSVRVHRKNPVMTLVALITLALGIGSNTAIFSLLHATLIEPIPYPEVEQIYFMGTQHPATGNRGAVSFQDFLSWQTLEAFSQMAAIGHEDVTMQQSEGAARVQAEIITAGYFDTLGIQPERGRVFVRSETDEVGGDNRVVILTHAFWQDILGGREPILGTRLTISGSSFEVVGVMPRGFEGIFDAAQIWLPITTFELLNPELKPYDILNSRGTRFLTGIGRLAEGVTIEQAQERLDVLAVALAEEFPRTNSVRGIVVDQAREELVGGFRTPLLLLLGAVAAVLLIAGTNLASLFLARADGRHRELAIRTAVGASSSRLIRQILTETVTLSVAGGLLGIALAAAGLRLIPGMIPHSLPGFVQVELSWPVLLFSLALSLVTGLAFGSLPAFRAARNDLFATLKSDERQASKSGRRRWFSGGLVAAEVALSLALLVATGLMLKSFYNMQIFDPGFEVGGLVTAGFSIPAEKYDAAGERQLVDRMLSRIQGLPLVTEAALTSHVFFGGGYMTGDFHVEGLEPAAPGERLISYRHYVSPEFFRTLRVPLQAGREFTEADRSDSLPVVVVNREMADRFWPGEDPLGKRITFGDPARGEVEWRTVVGVVGDVQPRLRRSGGLWQVYSPVKQGGEWSRYLMIRTAGSAETLAPSVRALIREIDPEVPLFDWYPMAEYLDNSAAPTGFLASLLGIFGSLGLFLSAVGIYGVMSNIVSRARGEIGIRMALGATRGQILGDFLRYGSIRALVGLLAGGFLSTWVASLLTSQLYEVKALDVGIFSIVALFLAGVAMLACMIPSWKASRLDPIKTIRTQ